MTFSFRVPFWLPPDQRLTWAERVLRLHSSADEHVYVQADIVDQITDADRLSLRGEGYLSAVVAAKAGSEWLGWLTLGLADLMIGVDFRPAGPRSAMSDFFLDAMQTSDPARRHFREHSGVLVFQSDPPPIFHGLDVAGVVPKRAEDLLERTLGAQARGARMSSELTLAYDVYASAMFQTSDEARFIVLMTAVEVLVPSRRRPDHLLTVIDELLERIKQSDSLAASEAETLANGIRTLKNESIRSSGRHLASRLTTRNYLGRPATDFWAYAYGLRSAASHGGATPQIVLKIREASPELQWFVRDLILSLSAPDADGIIL
jgi:hypothetical protein